MANMKIMVGIGGGGYLVQALNFIRQCPAYISLVIFAPAEIHEKISSSLGGIEHTFLVPPKALRQRRGTGFAKAMMNVAVGCYFAVKSVRKHRPDAIISIGQRVSIYLMFAARVTGIRGVFIECVTRVTQKSNTGKFISMFGLADKIFVQWPESTKNYRNAIYKGRLV